MLHLRISKHLGDGVDRANADILVAQKRHPGSARTLAENRLEGVPDSGFLRIWGAPQMLRAPTVRHKFRPLERLAQIFPQPGLGASHRQELPILRLVCGIEGVLPRVGAVSALRDSAVCEDMLHERCRRQERNGGVEIGHIDMLPRPV